MAEYGEPLTEREKEILCMVATGVTNREVAHQLTISINTVKVHLRNIYAKLGAESRTEATMIAVRERWVQVEGAESAERDRSEELGAAQPQVPVVASARPLPWLKRGALIVALLLVVAGIAVTWPGSMPQADAGPGLPLDQTGDLSMAAPARHMESRWHERAQMPTRRAYLALAAAESRIFAIGGQTPEGVTGAVEVYDPEGDIWTRRSDKPTPVTYVSAAVIGTEVYVPGGCDDTGAPVQTVEVYDVLTDSWHAVSPLPEPRCAYALAATDEKLYLFGGWDGERYTATAYVYDPQADAWSAATSMEMERGFAAAAAMQGGLYVVGGHDGERELTACTFYDPQAGAWNDCAPLAVGRGGLGLAALGGQLYAIGGGGWTSYLGFNERYNPNENTWNTFETVLVEEWRSPGVAVYDSSIYAIGGWSSDYLSLNQAYEALPFRTFIPVSHQ